MSSTPPHIHETEAAAADANHAASACTPASVATTHSSSELPVDCWMLRSLSRDFGSQCALLELLLSADIALLVRTCRTWSRWIHEPHALGKRHRSVTPSRFPQYLDCSWIRLPLRQFGLLPETEPLLIDQHDDAEMQARQARETQQLQFALSHLGPACFPRLERLGLCVRVPRIPDCALRDSFLSLAPRLRLLRCVLPLSQYAVLDDSTVHSLLAHVSLLPRLRTLWLVGAFADPRSASFAALPALRELSDFIFRWCADCDEIPVSWRATHEQVQCLARCEQLTKLECGSWTEDEDELDADHPRSRIEVLSQAKRPRAANTAAQRTLRSLDLRSTVMSADLLSHLAHLPELRDLWNAGWSADLSAAEWAPLASLSRLTRLSIAPTSSNLRLGVDSMELTSAHYLPALVQCSSLEQLFLAVATLTSEQMRLLVRSLPKLSLLRLLFVRMPLESLACLASLPRLASLALLCRPLSGAFANVRPHLPALAQLTELRVREPDECRLVAADVAQQNAALLARCPKLPPRNFHQNLICN